MKLYLLVGAGGFVGAVLRFAANQALAPRAGGLPLATLGVNVVGSFLLGALLALAASQRGLSEEWRLALGVGLCGALTTFSTFSVEVLDLAREASWRLALLHVLLNVALSLAAAWAGLRTLGYSG